MIFLSLSTMYGSVAGLVILTATALSSVLRPMEAPRLLRRRKRSHIAARSLTGIAALGAGAQR
jgi:hypothetical protein